MLNNNMISATTLMIKGVPVSIEKALEHFQSIGIKMADKEVVTNRLTICEPCSAFNDRLHLCRECNCLVDVKIHVKSSVCPIGKW